MGRRPLRPASFCMKTYSPRAARHRAPLVRDRRQRGCARASVDGGRRDPARQAQADLRPPHGHRRPRHRRERPRRPADGRQGGDQGRLSPLGLPGRAHGDQVRQAPGREARVRGREGDPGHAPEEPPRPGDVQEAPGLRRARPSALGRRSRSRCGSARSRGGTACRSPRTGPPGFESPRRPRPRRPRPSASPPSLPRRRPSSAAKKSTAKRPAAKPAGTRTAAKTTTAKRTTARRTKKEE